jgi:ketosteroid isomerase-like protein
MKKVTLFILVAVAAALFAACAAPASNTNTNSNANAAKPAAAAPTKEALFAMDKKANEAWIKGDAKHFEEMLSDKFVSVEMGKRMTKAEMISMVRQVKCDVKTWSLSDEQMSMIDADTAVISYKGTFDGTCTGPDGKSMKLPSPIRAASVWVRNGDKWQGAFHGETLIVTADPATPAANTTGKKEEPKKDEPKKEEPKKDDKAATDAKPADAKTGDAKPAGDANTEALVKLQTAGWEAWKAKDAKKFDDLVTKDLAFVSPMGDWMSGKADVIKAWTTMPCEGVTKVAFTDGVASALSPTVEVLTGKGTADGTCFGEKNGDLYQTAFYVKEGDAWKLAFMFETMPAE